MIITKKQQTQFISIFFIAFILLVSVGLEPLAERTGRLELDESGGGNFVRQVLFSVFALIFFSLYIRKKNNRLKSIVPIPIIICTLWIAFSITQSNVPDIAIRRYVLLIMTLVTIFSVNSLLTTEKTIKILIFTIIFLIFLSLLLGLTVNNAIHGHEEDAKLFGAWRGIFIHKNLAGLVAALGIILSLFSLSFNFWKKNQRILVRIGIILCIVLLVLSKSKTSMALLVPTILLGYLYSKILRMPKMQQFVIVYFSIFFIMGIISFGMIDQNEYITALLDDPSSFTGRAGIWQVSFEMIHDKFTAGHGYGSIYKVGSDSELLVYAKGLWFQNYSQGHNGYLDVTVATGIIGLIVIVSSFIIIPFFLIIDSKRIPDSLKVLLISLLYFVVLHNFLETSFLLADHMLWVVLLIICSIVYNKKIEGDF